MIKNSYLHHFLLTVVTISFITLSLIPLSASKPADKDRGIKIHKKKIDRSLVEIKINNIESFKWVKPNNLVAVLVGNNDYSTTSGFPPLQQCTNDTLLLSRIFSRCCKVPEKNINVFNNVTRDEFLERFQSVLNNLKKHQAILFEFSGHGDIDGSLVFIDGKRILPAELKALINSFNQDAIIMIDACYSGNNDGPLEIFEPSEQYRSNTIRIYGSLAHTTAKEIMYNNDFFKPVKTFAREVLEIDNISGNGYFTSLFAWFFVEYQMTRYENISFHKLLQYISNKGSQYAEYLAVRGIDLTETTKPLMRESIKRMNQIPKIYPLIKAPRLKEQIHSNLLIQRPRYQQRKITIDISEGPQFPMPINIPGAEQLWLPNHSLFISMAFEIPRTNGFSLGFGCGYFQLYQNDSSEERTPLNANMFPLLLVAMYQIPITAIPWLGLTFSGGIGPLVAFVYSGTDEREDIWTVALHMRSDISARFFLNRIIYLAIGFGVLFTLDLAGAGSPDLPSPGIMPMVSLSIPFSIGFKL